jgi:hypothetical protein
MSSPRFRFAHIAKEVTAASALAVACQSGAIVCTAATRLSGRAVEPLPAPLLSFAEATEHERLRPETRTPADLPRIGDEQYQVGLEAPTTVRDPRALALRDSRQRGRFLLQTPRPLRKTVHDRPDDIGRTGLYCPRGTARGTDTALARVIRCYSLLPRSVRCAGSFSLAPPDAKVRDGLLIRGSEVRILPGALHRKCALEGW